MGDEQAEQKIQQAEDTIRCGTSGPSCCAVPLASFSLCDGSVTALFFIMCFSAFFILCKACTPLAVPFGLDRQGVFPGRSKI